jgi:hypothetical protein
MTAKSISRRPTPIRHSKTSPMTGRIWQGSSPIRQLMALETLLCTPVFARCHRAMD